MVLGGLEDDCVLSHHIGQHEPELTVQARLDGGNDGVVGVDWFGARDEDSALEFVKLWLVERFCVSFAFSCVNFLEGDFGSTVCGLSVCGDFRSTIGPGVVINWCWTGFVLLGWGRGFPLLSICQGVDLGAEGEYGVVEGVDSSAQIGDHILQRQNFSADF